MGRKERRAEDKVERYLEWQEQQALHVAKYIVNRNAAREKVKNQLSQHGITPEMFKRECEKEYKRGWDAATEQIATFQMKMFYGGFALAMKREFKFGGKRIERALHTAEQIMLEELTTEEMIQKVLDETGLQLRFSGEKGEEIFYGL